MCFRKSLKCSTLAPVERQQSTEKTVQEQLTEITSRLDRQRQMMNILLILSMFQLFIFACTLITARKESHHHVEL